MGVMARVSGTRRIVVTGAVVALTIGLLGLRGMSGHAAAEAPAPLATATTAPPAPTPAPANPELDNAVREAKDFVAKTRGLPFTQPVKTTLLPDAEFAQRLTGGVAADPLTIKRAEGFLRALGLMHDGESLGDGSPESATAGIVGVYLPETKELIVRGTAVTPYTRSVLVHELTHAVQDQHFNLNRPDLAGRDDEAAQSFSALVEGDAVRIQRAYIDQMSPEDRAFVLHEDTRLAQSSGDGPKGPAAAGLMVLYPYIFGPRFVDGLLHHGGQPRLDAAFTKPPTTSQQIFVPELYLAVDGLNGYPLTYPEADGKVVDHGTMGAFGMVLILGDKVGYLTAGAAASTWMADRYVTWEQPDGKTCVRDRILLGSPWEAAYVAAVATQWAHAQRDAHVEAPGTVIVTSCA